MFIWRPIIAGKVTLNDLRSVYSLSDLCDYHRAIDLENEMVEHAKKKVTPK